MKDYSHALNVLIAESRRVWDAAPSKNLVLKTLLNTVKTNCTELLVDGSRVSYMRRIPEAEELVKSFTSYDKEIVPQEAITVLRAYRDLLAAGSAS